MSGIDEVPLTVKAVLWCKVCPARWESAPYVTDHDRSGPAAARPAFDLGWRVFVGSRSQHAYCPDRGPRSSMRQLHPAPEASR
ncbi:MAG: hypothetical protein ACO1ON_12930 [Nocardioides sp.]